MRNERKKQLVACTFTFVINLVIVAVVVVSCPVIMYKHTVKSKLSQARSTPPFAAAAAAPLGAGKKFFSHIRHKIEDNLTPRLSGRLYYKGSKHTRSLSTLSLAGGDGSDGGCVGGKYTPTRTAVGDAETPLQAAMKAPAKIATTMTICSYVDSDEEDSPLSLSLTHQSLEDEIFAELEKVAHDESKLNEVLQSFDQILQEYPPAEECTVQSEIELLEQCKQQSVLQLELQQLPPPAQFSDSHTPKLSKSYSTLGNSCSSSTRQLYQTPELAQARLLRRCSSGSRYSSLCELSQITGSRIPISKHSSLRSLDRGKQQQQQEQEQSKPNKQPQPSHPKRQQQQQLRTRSLLTLNTNGSQVAAAAAAAAKVKSPPARAHSTLERRPLSRRGRSANAHSDELLVKCLAKGHELLRKVENLNGGKAVRPSRGVSKKRQLHKQLQFASEEKVGKPKLESCKIIPPKLGETSDKNHELLVKVVQQQRKSVEQSVSDSDDSGHISNAAMHSSASSNSSSSALNSTSNSTGSLCESEGDVELGVEREPVRDPEPETEQETMLLCRPNKIAELLEKFEAKSKKGQLRVVSKVQAQVQAVRCIQTQVEIYPTYTKEVTMRLH